MDAASTMVSQMPPPPSRFAFHPAQDQLVQAVTADSCPRELRSTTTDNPEMYGFNTEQYFWVVHEQSEQQQAAGLGCALSTESL